MSAIAIESSLQEKRLFPPPIALSQTAFVQSLEDYHRLHDRAVADPEDFWGKLAETELHWFQKWDRVLDWQPPFARWFVGGKLNVSDNCLDRHLTTERRDKPALMWEEVTGDLSTLEDRSVLDQLRGT